LAAPASILELELREMMETSITADLTLGCSLGSMLVSGLPDQTEIEKRIVDEVKRRRDELVELTQEFVRTPSVSGEEGLLAKLMAERMKDFGFDNVRIDEAGNVLGSVGGSTDDGALMFNGHMDHVPPSDMLDPYSGEVRDGAPFGVSGPVIVGRAASDMKGALAAMIVAGSVLRELKVPLKRRMIVAGVVQEETNGLGSRFLARNTRLGGVVIGESTNLDVALGHRGSMAIDVITEGVSCHASAPERGVNALYKMVPIIQGVEEAAGRLPSHAVLGKSSMVATTISVTPNVKNVVPNLCSIAIDVRNTINFSPDEAVQAIRGVVEQARSRHPEIKAKVELAKRSLKSYTGYAEDIDAMTPPFYTEPDDPLAQMTKQVSSRALGRETRFKVWTFATDGSYFTERGTPTVGFGPGEERFAHSRNDNVSIEHLIESAQVYAALTAEFGQRTGR